MARPSLSHMKATIENIFIKNITTSWPDFIGASIQLLTIFFIGI